MAKKLYVGNLAFSVTTEQLRDLFVKQGEVAEAIVLTDKQTGRSRGFGFVTMANDADAQKAITALNGTDFDGRPIVVNEARERPENGRGGRGPGGDRGGFGGGRGPGGRRGFDRGGDRRGRF
jgi:cold-inducible RNA-binding protein